MTSPQGGCVMNRKTLQWIRIVVACLAIACCTLLACVCSSCLSIAWGCAVLDILGDVSAILFGVFGIWLGMFYNPDIADALNGKSGKELDRIAHKIVADGERFSVVFRGMKTSAIVLVFAMLVRTFQAPAAQVVSSWPSMLRAVVRHAFFVLVRLAVLAQCYSVLMSLAPMYDAKRKMEKAKRDAEATIAL